MIEQFRASLRATVEQMPGFFAWKDCDSVIQAASAQAVELSGFQRADQLVGLRDGDLRCRAAEHALVFQQQDQFAIKNGSSCYLEIITYARGVRHVVLANKKAVFDSEGQLAGSLSTARNVSSYCLRRLGVVLADDETYFKKTNNLSFRVGANFGDELLTPKELEVIFYLLRRRPYDQIGRFLGLNLFEVSSYLVAIKNKFNCNGIDSLIEKALFKGYWFFLPQSLVNEKLYLTIEE